MKINIYKYLEKTKVEGPGVRFCIWVQGCSRHCDGCWAKNTWSFEPNQLFSVEELFELILKQKGIEGVTFLGGEPFEQADALSLLAQKVKSIGLSVLTFTGNSYEKLIESKDSGIQNLLKYTDLLVDGEFKKQEFDISRPWVGSSNQRYIFLTDRYSIDEIMQYKNKAEVRIDKDGGLFINGMGDFRDLLLKIYLQKK